MPADLITVFSRPNDPKKHPYYDVRSVKPVTNEDLGGPLAIHMAAMRGIGVEIVEMDEVPAEEYRFNRMYEALHQVTEGRAKLRAVDYIEWMNLHTVRYDFGDAIAPYIYYLFAENFRDVADEIARRGLYFANMSGFLPYKAPPIPSASVEYLREKLGTRFLGMNNGEHDCRFVINVCYMYPQPATRKQAHENFLDYEYFINNSINRYAATLSNNTFQHYLADIPYTRILGCQICESKPSISLWFAMLRGAGRQYGLLWWASPAECNLWGGKVYESNSEEQYKPDRGTSLSLLRRAYLLAYMYGASVIMGQYAFFNDDKTLSPIGEIYMDTKRFIKTHPKRGVTHTPVAMIYDFFTGYVTAKHAPLTKRPYHVWGNIPYDRGDYAISEVNNAFYPNMNESGYWRDESGFLVETPCGDVLDVLMSNTSMYTLSQYNAAIVINAQLEGKFLEVLSTFIQNGGSVATSVSQLTKESLGLFGIEKIGEKKIARSGTTDGITFNEADFIYYDVVFKDDVDVVARTYDGDPLAVEIQTRSNGVLLLLLSDKGLSEQVCDVPETCPTESILPRPYLLLRHVENLLFRFVARWHLVDVQGKHTLQWVVNVNERDDEVILTLVNNNVHAWHGSVGFINADIEQGEDWTNGQKIPAGKRCEVSLQPNDIRIMRLRADRAIMIRDTRPYQVEEKVELESAKLYDAYENGQRQSFSMQQPTYLVYDKKR